MPAFAAVFLATATFAHAQEKFTYDDYVQPIVSQRCGRCHNEDKQKAGFIATTYAGVMAGSSGGVVVVAGEPDASNLFLAITHRREPTMPPGGNKIPQSEIDVIRKWIEGGLLENGGSKAKPKKKRSGVDLKAAIVTLGRPAEPPPMPQELVLEPVMTSARAGALESLAADPWAPILALGGQQQVLLVSLAAREPGGIVLPELAGVLPFPEGLPQSLAFSRDGRVLVASGGRGAASGRVVGWNVTDGRRLFEVGDEGDAILAADLSPDQKCVAFGTTDKLVKVVTTDGAKVHLLKKHTDWVTAVAYSPDGVLLATGDRNGNLSIWEAGSGREYQALAGHTAAITALAWRDDANLLASSSEDGTLRLWEMQEGKQVKSWPAHGGGALGVAMAHDGRLASCGRDRAVKVWSADGQLLKQCDGLGDVALRVAFDCDGTRVIAGDWNGLVRVWNAADATVVGDVALNPPKLADRLAVAERRVAAAKAEADGAVVARVAVEAAEKETSTRLVPVPTEGEVPAAAPAAADRNTVAGPPSEVLIAARKNEEAATAKLVDATHEVARWQAELVNVEWHSARAELDAAQSVRDGKAAAVDAARAAMEAARAAVAAAEQELADAPQRIVARDGAITAARTAARDRALALEAARAVAREKATPLATLASSAADLHARAAQAPDDAELAAAARSVDEVLAHVNGSVAAALAAVLLRRGDAENSMQAIMAARGARVAEEAHTAALPKTIDDLRSRVAPTVAALAAAGDALIVEEGVVAAKREVAAGIESRYRERLAAAR